MGKKKDKYKGGSSSSAFDAYMANLSTTGIPGPEVTPLPDSMKASTLLEQIGVEKSWLPEQTESDLTVLEQNRLYTVNDLRTLSLESWKEIKLLPLVKDLVREAIGRGQPPQDDYLAKRMEKQARKAQKKRDKAEKRERKAREKETERGKRQQEKAANRQETVAVDSNSSKEKTKEATSIYETDEKSIVKSGASCSSSCSDSSSSSDSSDDKEDSQEGGSSALSPSPPAYSFAPQKPGKQVIGNRLRIRTATGQAYEVDRYCPHKRVDLATRGVVLGSKLICTKHNWEFSLDQGGRCLSEGATINACPIYDW